MKSICFGLVFFCLINLFSCQMKNDKKDMHSDSKETLRTGKKLRHVVLFKFKKDASKSDIVKVEVAFAELPSKIKEIQGFEWGLNNSPENLNKGFTHGFLLTFDSEKERDIYLPHLDHKAFGEVVGPILEDVMVFDYWTD